MTFGAKIIEDIRVGIAIIANEPSIILIAESKEMEAKKMMVAIKMYKYNFCPLGPKRNLAHTEP